MSNRKVIREAAKKVHKQRPFIPSLATQDVVRFVIQEEIELMDKVIKIVLEQPPYKALEELRNIQRMLSF